MDYRSKRPFLECPTCGTRYQQRRAGQVFCSVQCSTGLKKDGQPQKRRARRPDQICEGCGTSYHPKRRGTRYCTRECAWSHEYPQRWVGHQKKPQFSRVFFRQCQDCQSPFSTRWESKRFCSARCCAAFQKRGKECCCVVCGETFQPAYGDKTRKLCSESCRTERIRGTRRAVDAKNRGATEADATITLKGIRRRDRDQCQLCGAAISGV